MTAYVRWSELDKTLPPCPHCTRALVVGVEITPRGTCLHARCHTWCVFRVCTGVVDYGALLGEDEMWFNPRQFDALMWQLRAMVDLTSQEPTTAEAEGSR